MAYLACPTWWTKALQPIAEKNQHTPLEETILPPQEQIETVEHCKEEADSSYAFVMVG